MIKKKWIFIIFLISIISIYIYFFRSKDKGENVDILNIYEGYINSYNTTLEKEEDKKSKIVVHITGAIKNEGVYELEENSRVADIIDIAGGLTSEADIRNINLASVLDDGVKIYIPKVNDKDNEIIDNIDMGISKEQNNSKNSNNSNDISRNHKININSASQTELESLPGIGAATAKKIIDYRKENGKFNSIEDIKKVNGIGESKYNKIKSLIKV